ncbi:hypothetical protein QCN35_gp58 [Arthrobacter phage Synepsis]|uniref:Uncharacterized protein n=3 Tax=Gordonvirus TaxID=1982152 RepID=A0A345KUL8_9CAUD|nr:hypothetical protein QCN35_gp58 [Arthrobacter phage Synepsis]AXH46720.1 hypothetical protein SEA_SYNEPSIS_58 [Arthrobacter phage Synepsis]
MEPRTTPKISIPRNARNLLARMRTAPLNFWRSWIIFRKRVRLSFRSSCTREKASPFSVTPSSIPKPTRWSSVSTQRPDEALPSSLAQACWQPFPSMVTFTRRISMAEVPLFQQDQIIGSVETLDEATILSPGEDILIVRLHNRAGLVKELMKEELVSFEIVNLPAVRS